KVSTAGPTDVDLLLEHVAIVVVLARCRIAVLQIGNIPARPQSYFGGLEPVVEACFLNQGVAKGHRGHGALWSVGDGGGVVPAALFAHRRHPASDFVGSVYDLT